MCRDNDYLVHAMIFCDSTVIKMYSIGDNKAEKRKRDRKTIHGRCLLIYGSSQLDVILVRSYRSTSSGDSLHNIKADKIYGYDLEADNKNGW